MSRKTIEMRPTFIEVTPDLRQFGRVHQPGDAESPILTAPVRSTVHRWLVELQAEAELEAVGLKPRRTAILSGPPGCGKTTLAHHLAARLGVALVEVNMSTLVGSLLGETGRNLHRLFSAAAAKYQDLILLLDEIDSIATKRTSQNTSAGRDDNHTVISLMSQMDHYPGVVIAATNRADQIDEALWRRFGMQLDIGAPDNDTRYAIISKYLSPYQMDDAALCLLNDLTVGATPSLIRNLMEGLKRDLILQPKFGGEATAAATLYRVASSLQPHADISKPPLWDDLAGCIRRLKGINWPPTLPEGGAT